jgi:hypothetical protein
LEQLAEETFLIREPGSGTRDAMERAFSAHRFRSHETVEMGSNETIKQAVMVGMGVSFLSLHTTGLELATKQLAALKVDGMPVMRDWCVIPIRFGKESRRLRIVYEVATHSMCHPNRQLERPVDASDVPAEQEAGHEGIWRVLRAGLMRGQIAVFQQSFVDLLRPPVFCR